MAKKIEEVIEKMPKKVGDALVGKSLGGYQITKTEDIVISGKSLKKISLSDNTTTILSIEDLEAQAK